jgi:hypothetical protein
MKQVIDHLTGLIHKLDDLNREMSALATWNEKSNRFERNIDEQEARCKRGACLTVNSVYHGDGIPSTCQFCGKPGQPCAHPKDSWCTGCRETK